MWLALLGSAALVVWGYQGGPTRGDVPLTPPPTVAHTPTAAPVTASSPTPPPASATTTSTPSTPPLRDLTGSPVHLEIRQDDELLVSAPIELTQLNSRGELYPDPKVIGWYGPPEWNTVPGNESAHPGIFAGHVTYSGVKDVFFRLGEVRAGDVITVTYDDGMQAQFVVDGDALSAPKNDITDKAETEYAWVWSLPEPSRRISVFSCDPSQGRDLSGHSLHNWVVQATRIA